MDYLDSNMNLFTESEILTTFIRPVNKRKYFLAYLVFIFCVNQYLFYRLRVFILSQDVRVTAGPKYCVFMRILLTLQNDVEHLTTEKSFGLA